MVTHSFLQNIWLIPALPLLGFLLNGLPLMMGKKLPNRYAHSVACGVMFLAFAVAVGGFLGLQSLPSEQRSFTLNLWDWMHVGSLKVNVAFLLDPLSSIMTLIITGIGSLIHIYSIGYMHGDKSYNRFFTYLNLFCFMMLLLVMGDNLLMLFVGWEGVGLASYLLIGFWFEEKANGAAGMKAFVVNRVGDFGLMIGLLLMFWTLFSQGVEPTLVFTELKVAVASLGGVTILGISAVTLICIFLFVGATGKSAQIPLYVWLPDAMAGPTPVSALIHAATMVTAGVYMIGRMNWLFSMSEVALTIIATVGALTAFFAATVGFTQNDIKKVLAYSTVSQLGYMFLGMGTAVYFSGIFHLMTHAFFKACLFLGSGSVILGVHHEQDMRLMGGLKKYMPTTYKTFLIATIAIAGIFPLSGFFSKDEILWQTFSKGHDNSWYYVLWVLGVFSAAGTAFYMCRLVMMTFFGKYRGHDEAVQKQVHGHHHSDAHHDDHHDDHHHDHGHHEPHESPKTMTFPLIVLAVLSAFGGLLGIPHIFHLPNLMAEWLSPVIPLHHGHGSLVVEGALMIFSVAVAAAALFAGYFIYSKRPEIAQNFAQKFSGLYRVVFNKYFVDEFYTKVFVNGVLKIDQILSNFDQKVVDGLVNLVAKVAELYSRVAGWFDGFFVDGTVNGFGKIAYSLSGQFKKVQSGQIQRYAFVALLGIIITLIIKIIL